MSREDEAEMIMYVSEHFSDQSNMKRTVAFTTIYNTNIYDATATAIVIISGSTAITTTTTTTTITIMLIN